MNKVNKNYLICFAQAETFSKRLNFYAYFLTKFKTRWYYRSRRTLSEGAGKLRAEKLTRHEYESIVRSHEKSRIRNLVRILSPTISKTSAISFRVVIFWNIKALLTSFVVYHAFALFAGEGKWSSCSVYFYRQLSSMLRYAKKCSDVDTFH